MMVWKVIALIMAASSAQELCFSVNNTFTTIYDPLASTTGYYRFEECDGVQPTLAMERGVTYTFKQYDKSNWYHPLGFAYFADGAHKDVDELEPSIGGACALNFTCQAPMYFLNGNYVGGTYDNSVSPVVGGEDFGLDNFEPDFFLPRADWIDKGQYEVHLTLTDDDYAEDIFYFCHIHNEMSGRIKIVDQGVPVNPQDTPELGYEYEVPSEFDAACGTFGAEIYQTGSGVCSHDTFVCLDGAESSDQALFSECLAAVDCAMDYGMRTNIHDSDPAVTFMHQMIPHHENAVNMAKMLLRFNDTLDPEANDDDADIITMLWEIINTQNFQINTMENWLSARNHPRNDICCRCDARRRNLLFGYQTDAACVCP